MKIIYLTVDPRSLASTITCEKVRKFLDKYKYSSIVIEHLLYYLKSILKN